MCTCSVRIRSCCCCSLWVATVLTLIYCFIWYSVSLGLASWGLAKTIAEPVADGETGIEYYYRLCDYEAFNHKSYEYRDGGNEVVIRDVSATPYHCSLALYWEQLKLSAEPRFPVLIVDIIIYGLAILATLIAVVGLCLSLQWLLVPLIGMIALDIIRGLISTIIIFIYSYVKGFEGSLIRIAIGIFFLGVQIFHISLILVLIAMVQYFWDRKHGVDQVAPFGVWIDSAEKWVATGQTAYPTLPSSHYAYNTGSPQSRREGFYQPHPPSRQHSQAAYSTYDNRYH